MLHKFTQNSTCNIQLFKRAITAFHPFSPKQSLNLSSNIIQCIHTRQNSKLAQDEKKINTCTTAPRLPTQLLPPAIYLAKISCLNFLRAYNYSTCTHHIYTTICSAKLAVIRILWQILEKSSFATSQLTNKIIFYFSPAICQLAFQFHCLRDLHSRSTEIYLK